MQRHARPIHATFATMSHELLRDTLGIFPIRPGRLQWKQQTLGPLAGVLQQTEADEFTVDRHAANCTGVLELPMLLVQIKKPDTLLLLEISGPQSADFIDPLAGIKGNQYSPRQ